MVVAILAVVAGSLMLKQGETTEKAKASMAISEMNHIKKALLQYRQDMGGLPTPANPADFSSLYVIGGSLIWNPDIGRGWRGPYLTALGEGHTDIGDNLKNDGTGSPVMIDTAPGKLNVRSVADTFAARPVLPGSYDPCVENAMNNNCLLDWRTLADDGDTDDEDGDKAHDRHGRPYLLFELNIDNRARLISMGPDGRYDGVTCPSASASCVTCSPNGDDLLACLLR